jgi:hypothetical protein
MLLAFGDELAGGQKSQKRNEQREEEEGKHDSQRIGQGQGKGGMDGGEGYGIRENRGKKPGKKNKLIEN